jgi:hypothetical protein
MGQEEEQMHDGEHKNSRGQELQTSARSSVSTVANILDIERHTREELEQPLMLHPHKRTAGSHQANNIAVHAILEVTAQLAPRPNK